jgi:hypothetical protein
VFTSRRYGATKIGSLGQKLVGINTHKPPQQTHNFDLKMRNTIRNREPVLELN